MYIQLDLVDGGSQIFNGLDIKNVNQTEESCSIVTFKDGTIVRCCQELQDIWEELISQGLAKPY